MEGRGGCRSRREVWIVKDYWFGLDLWALPGRETASPEMSALRKPRDGDR